LWTKDYVILTTPIKNYTAFNVDEFLTDLKYSDGLKMYQNKDRVVVDLDTPP
jgi:hypothetical protein